MMYWADLLLRTIKKKPSDTCLGVFVPIELKNGDEGVILLWNDEATWYFNLQDAMRVYKDIFRVNCQNIKICGIYKVKYVDQ